MKLVHWPLMGGLFFWYSEEGTGRGRTKCNSPPINGQCTITALLYNGPLLCGFNVTLKGLSNRHTGTNFVHAWPHNMACRVVPSQWHDVCHVVLSVTHKLRTVHEMRNTQRHACALDNFVVTSRDILEMNFWTSQNFRHNMACTTSLNRDVATHPHARARVLPSLARQICAMA